MKYSQPAFYKITEDSILLKNFVCEQLNLSKGMRVLDAFAGCGVIGVEVYKLHPYIKLSFNELQSEYLEFILDNCKKFEVIFEDIHIRNVTQVQTSYDLVTMNPPYFNSLEGRSSSNVQRQLSRSISEAQAEEIKQHLKNLVSLGGHLALSHLTDCKMWTKQPSDFKLIKRMQVDRLSLSLFQNK